MNNQELENEQLGLVLDTKQQTSQFPLNNAYDKLNQFFDEKNQQQRSILEAREILGNSAGNLSDDEVFDLVNEVQYLVDSWIEEYEETVFDGNTLNVLLGLK